MQNNSSQQRHQHMPPPIGTCYSWAKVTPSFRLALYYLYEPASLRISKPLAKCLINQKLSNYLLQIVLPGIPYEPLTNHQPWVNMTRYQPLSQTGSPGRRPRLLPSAGSDGHPAKTAPGVASVQQFNFFTDLWWALNSNHQFTHKFNSCVLIAVDFTCRNDFRKSARICNKPLPPGFCPTIFRTGLSQKSVGKYTNGNH